MAKGLIKKETDTSGQSPPKSKKLRSPNYPGIPIGKALERAGLVYEKIGRHDAPVEAIVSHWNYKPKTGPSLVTIGALKAYGLFETGSNSGRLKLTDLALRIIQDKREDSLERVQAIREAALKPAIHQSVWQKFGANLPSEPDLKYYLLREKAFTEGGVDLFIAQYKATLAFANLAENGTVLGAQDDEAPEEETQKMNHGLAPKPPAAIQPVLPPGTREIPIPIPGTAWPSLKAAFPMSEEAWESMLQVLRAMKPGLVKPADE